LSGARARYFVALGGNLDDRLAHLREAARTLAALSGVELKACSSVWETRPLGPGRGPFLNAAVELRAARGPEELLAELRSIEDAHGRLREQRWGDRTLDLDLLCGFSSSGRALEVASPRLSLPHPEIGERDFVLRPLLELDAELEIAGRACAAMLAALDEEQRTILRRLDAELDVG
jgi:2-amino-4-hydroxy-6-hydroxymethyldihydropteridine diphosphokinase